MDKRIRLGFVYNWDESWLGGIYYIQNLLKSLNTLDDARKPIVHLYCLNNKAFNDIQVNTNYPYMEKTILKKSLYKRVYRWIVRFFDKDLAERIEICNFSGNDDVIYPWSEGSVWRNLVYWVADFQANYMPQLFTKKEIDARNRSVVGCCKRGIPIVFSSADAQNDFYKFYPGHENHPTFVVRFAASLPDFSNVDIETVKLKYGINKRYLFCANQFWQHKNHLFMFKAYKKALDKGLDVQLVCTGKMSDYRSPQYIGQVNDFICQNHLEHDILTLGMIDKKELLCLMKHSYAVIQPSLFEGWNTTVEDCKAMSKFVYLSNLRVHKEQMEKNVCFFDPYNEDDLVNKLLTVNPVEELYDYSKNVKQFSEDFYHVIYTIKSSNM